jgi:serine/threonine protein kinase
MSTQTGAVVGGRYEMLRSLGRGAFGHTYLARDREADRDVAVKLLDSRAGHDAKAYELFRREADVLRAVRHHGIPEIHDALQDEWNGAPATFLVMEYIEGTSLAQIIDEGRVLDRADVVHVFLELLGVLDYLHGRVPPILHRDIKPSNIIVRPNGFPALVDFGSVRRVFMGPEEAGSTVAGTYGYMPYEQYMGQATPASDLFATAATFLHLLTGRPPKDFMNDDGRIQVPEMLPGEPRLRIVIARLLRPSPAERFASAREVRDALVGEEKGTALAAVRPAGLA